MKLYEVATFGISKSSWFGGKAKALAYARATTRDVEVETSLVSECVVSSLPRKAGLIAALSGDEALWESQTVVAEVTNGRVRKS